MPYGDLNPGARRRHNVRVVTVGRYRMLKDTNTHKVRRTLKGTYYKRVCNYLRTHLDWNRTSDLEKTGVSRFFSAFH